MTKPTIFSIRIKGAERALFSVQERASGDLTLIVKHSLFHNTEEGSKASEADLVNEERFSIHQSGNSEKVNVIKYTKVMRDGRVQTTRNYSEALKLKNQFSGIFVRRSGDMSHDRYRVYPNKGTIYSLGKYDPEYFQPVVIVLAGRSDRHFGVTSPENKNVMQVRFQKFSLTIIWQFLAFTGGTTTRSLLFKTFTDQEISAAPTESRPAMLKMRDGFTELEAIDVYDRAKYDLAMSLFSTTWNRSSNEEKIEYGPIMLALMEFDGYVKNGRPFSLQHMQLLKRIAPVIAFHRAQLNGKIPEISWPAPLPSMPS